VFVTPSKEIWWFHNGPPPAEDVKEHRDRLIDLHREDPPWIAEVLRATPELLGPWPIHDLEAVKRWHSGRICLIGDAAHAMSPSAGQGASLAMEDALVLAQCLRDLSEPSESFAKFERLRRPRVDAMFRAARRNSSGKAMQSSVTEWFRDRMLPLFLKLGAPSQDRAYAHRLEWEQRVG
jgi:2-polyprenyl-6-methoxyphenol hydroxylase-like FAD-dependent oxidoreductase